MAQPYVAVWLYMAILIHAPVSSIFMPSNSQVMAKAEHIPATSTLRKRRLQLWGKVLRTPVQNPMCLVCFIGNTYLPATEQYVRRVGRPSKEWVRECGAEAASLFGSVPEAAKLAQSRPGWNAALQSKLGF